MDGLNPIYAKNEKKKIDQLTSLFLSLFHISFSFSFSIDKINNLLHKQLEQEHQKMKPENTTNNILV